MLWTTNRQRGECKKEKEEGPLCGPPKACTADPQMPVGERERGVGEVLALDPWGRAAFPQLPFHPTLSCVRLNVPGVGIHQQRTGQGAGSFTRERSVRQEGSRLSVGWKGR